MVIVGGAVAYIQQYEASEIRWSAQQHVLSLLSCWIKATLVASLIFYMQQSFRLDLPLCFVATGLLSVFASDAIKKMYELAMKWIFFKASPGGRDERK